MFKTNIQQSIFYFLSLIFLLSSIRCFQIQPIHHRLKRQIEYSNDKQHYSDMLQRLLSHRNTSSISSDCTINMDTDGIYKLPSENTLAYQIIHLIEQTFENELTALKQTGEKIRKNLTQNAHLRLEQFRNDFSLDLRLLLASQNRIKEIDVRFFSSDNGGIDLIRYTRKTNSLLSIADYDSISNDIKQQETILQSFTMSNVRETLNDDSEKILTRNGWWLGPVICEKNQNEAFMMAHIFPLVNG